MAAFCERAAAVQGTAYYPAFRWTNLERLSLVPTSNHSHKDSVYIPLIQHQKATSFAEHDVSLLIFIKVNPLPQTSESVTSRMNKRVASPHAYE